MDTAWITPPALLLGAAGIAAILLRRLSQAINDLGASQRRVRQIEGALIPVRVETERAGAAVDRLTRR